MKLCISKDKIHFEKAGQPFFWLGDTLWSAFTSMTDAELDTYLTLRAQQGFNVVQLNLLPQWDRCWVPAQQLPFPYKDDGTFDYTVPMNEAYFAHAAAVCAKIVSYGFTPALAVLWSNYVPGTWASNIVRGNSLPKNMLAPYCQKVAETFDRFDPVYIISGDTDFDTPEAVEYYTLVMQEMRRLCPDTPQTMHIRGLYTYLPPEIAESIDFYVYQSGHNATTPEKCYTMPQEMMVKYPRKPILNAEPCYEQIGYSGNKYGRFNTKDVRRAAWMSVLSGACAGVTYGAHGIWNWQKPNLPLNPVMGEGFDAAKQWTEALQFPGAWDYGYLKQMLEGYGVLSLLPSNRISNCVYSLRKITTPEGHPGVERVAEPNTEIRMATTPDGKTSFIYAPFNTKVLVQGDYSGYRVRVIDMKTHRIAVPQLEVADGVTSVALCPFEEDILIVMEQNEQ